MKLYVFAVLVALLVDLGFAQVAPAPSPTSAPAAAAASPQEDGPKNVAPDAAVITVNGACKMPGARAGECKTVITRTEFERLMTVLSRQRNGQAQKSIPPEAKQQLAMQYSRLLQFAYLAEKQGLQNTPEAKELIHFLRLQAMTEELARNLQQKAEPTPEEIQSYYDHNQARYTEWYLQRVVVPLGPKAKNQPNTDDLKRLAEDFRQRASQGGDFDALQKEAYEKTGMKEPPAAKLVLTPGTSLPDVHSPVYRLKPGEVSQVIEDHTGFYIYKLDSSSVVPLERNRAVIQELLAGQKAQEAIRQLVEANKVTLNPDYFEPVHQNAPPKTSAERPLAGAAAPAETQ